VNPAGSARRPGARRRRRVLVVAALVLVAVLIAPAVSYARALTAPGSAPWGMRTVDWIRSNHGGAIVNAVENWYYTRHQPAAGPPDPASLPQQTGPSTAPARGPAPPALPLPAGVAALPGESRWAPGRLAADGRPLIYTSFLRPDPRHLSVVVGVAWLRAGTTVGHLVAGTAQPGGSDWPGDAAVPSGDVPELVATFNSGFKLADISGGFYLGGRTAKPLRNGQASLVIDNRGQVTVGQWGRDVSMNASVVAVRQNLALVVDGGRPVDGLAGNAHGRWGTARNQLQYTWRSGVGLDARGDLVYVAGNSLNLTMLATAMADAGIVRGMQLDIHSGMASFASWRPGSGGSVAHKLLPGMSRSADRYLVADQRDFFYFTVR
jgi:hypothetical protein